MILIEFLFAPTVPSEPRPQKTHWTVPVLLDGERGIIVQAGMRDIVRDTDCEVVFRLCLAHFVKHAFDHGWRKLFRAQPITSADDPWTKRARPIGLVRLRARPQPHQGRVALRRYPVLWCDPARQSSWCSVGAPVRRRDRKRSEEMDGEHADLLALSNQILDRFLDGFRP